MSSPHTGGSAQAEPAAEPLAAQAQVDAPSQEAQQPTRIGAWQLFIAFSQMSIGGFGGVFPMVYRTLVERRRWLSGSDFAAVWAFGQMLPGTVVGNVATMVGLRFAGARGAFAAVLGLVLWPTLILFGCWLLYVRYGDLALVRQALGGMSAAAVGLTIATVLKVSRNLPRLWRNLLIAAAVFVAIGLLRLPFLGVFAVAAPLSLWLTWRDTK